MQLCLFVYLSVCLSDQTRNSKTIIPIDLIFLPTSICKSVGHFIIFLTIAFFSSAQSISCIFILHVTNFSTCCQSVVLFLSIHCIPPAFFHQPANQLGCTEHCLTTVPFPLVGVNYVDSTANQLCTCTLSISYALSIICSCLVLCK